MYCWSCCRASVTAVAPANPFGEALKTCLGVISHDEATYLP
jgi:hypothetical protein